MLIIPLFSFALSEIEGHTHNQHEQMEVTYEVSGKVLTELEKPAAFINVTLAKTDDEENILYAAITQDNGRFTISKVGAGDYIMKILGVGYTTLKRVLTVREDLDVGTLKITASESLDAVTIKARKPVVDVQPDKTVLNVDQMATVAGDNSLELLRRAPGVRLDNDENIIVEGRTGTTIYINGRQSYLQGDDLKDYLRSLTADDIDTIEVITQPSSKYDAEGAAGIINIVLKRVKGRGLRGSASSTLTVGDFARTNNSLNLTYRSEDLDIGGNYSNYIGRRTSFLYLNRFQGGKNFDSRTDSEFNRFSNNLNLNLTYRLDDRHSIGGQFSGNTSKSDSEQNNRTPIIDLNTITLDSVLLVPARTDGFSTNLNGNFNYTYKDTLGNKFTADADYGAYGRTSENLQPNRYLDPQGNLLSSRINFQKTSIAIDIYALKADYSTQLGNGNFSAGTKVSLVQTENDFDFFNRRDGTDELNTDRSNLFFYDEQIRAGYLNYAFDILKPDEGSKGASIEMQAGVRVEQTVSKGDLRTLNAQPNEVVERNYTNLFPSSGLTYKPSWKNSYSLLYSRRIERPSYSVLNPFEFQINELSSRQGNPFLQPQYVDNIKLSHTYKYKLTTSLSYSYVSDYFAQVTEPEPDGSNFIITRNVADQQIINLSISYPFDITDNWSSYINTYVTRNEFTGTDPSFISVDQTTFGGYAQTSYAFAKAWKVEASGWYSSPSIWGGTYRTESIGSLNLAVEKSWERWTAKLSLNDVLFTSPWEATLDFPGLNILGTGGSDSRQVRFYLRYNFGYDDVKEIREREGSSEDEQDRV